MKRRASPQLHVVPPAPAGSASKGPSPPSFASAATITRIEGGAVAVERARDGAEQIAEVALLTGYAPAVGDRVLVVESDIGPTVIAVLATSSPLVLVSQGDLVLKAPSGSVRLDAAVDVAVTSARDAALTAGRRVSLGLSGPAEETAEDLASRVAVERKGVTVVGPVVETRAKRARLVTAAAEVVAQAIRTSATTLETRARKIDVTAEHVVRRAKDALDEVSGLLETRAGRVRSLVRGAFSLRSKTTALRSSEDTSVDGRRVLLG